MLYKLQKPDLDNINSEKFSEILLKFVQNKEHYSDLYQETLTPEYLYWDKIKYKPLPTEFKVDEFWKLTKFIRSTQATESVIKDENGKFYSWIKLPSLEKFFHEVDLNTGGNLFVFAGELEEGNRRKFITRGVMEEAIASSQLEGAHTTRKVAKELLREGRKPRNTSEQMILNSYQTLQVVETDYKNKKMDLKNIFELHEMITKNTVPVDEQGRFRRDEENIVITDKATGYIYHQPPKIKFVEEEMEKFIKFANDELGEPFIHPIIKAIMIHFWVAYLHPFTDGNGRLARIMFYWYLLKKNYWAFAYLPISKIIKKSPAQYGRAYIYAEQDDCDLTYFIDYNIRKIKTAIEEFKQYLEEKSRENSRMNMNAKTKYKLNDRQIQLLQFYYKNKDEKTSLVIHLTINQISKATAASDLNGLEKYKFIKAERIGRNIYYYGTEKIKELFV